MSNIVGLFFAISNGILVGVVSVLITEHFRMLEEHSTNSKKLMLYKYNAERAACILESIYSPCVDDIE